MDAALLIGARDISPGEPGVLYRGRERDQIEIHEFTRLAKDAETSYVAAFDERMVSFDKEVTLPPSFVQFPASPQDGSLFEIVQHRVIIEMLQEGNATCSKGDR
jgi:hypothetical protein